ncbi:MAG TPA: tetratricopeptide repeat protein [Rhizomicrobium sp.]|nr:tetratricopeptide repeat protein [Rhizomicrobium sp.]
MRRSLVRIVGLGFCASALAGCGMMGGGTDDSTTPAPVHATDNTPMAPDVTTAIRQAQLMRVSGNLDGALKILSQLMLGAPDDPRVVGEYGKLLVQQNRMADAVQFLNRAIELQPADWTLYSALGVAYDRQNDPTHAKLAYERGLGLKPGEPALLNNFAMSRMLAGDTAAARTLMMQAQASGSTDPRIAQNLALLDSRTAVGAEPIAVAAATPPVAAPRTPVVVVGSTSPAHGAPLPIAHGNAQVVMQDVPVDPLAGPVGHAAHPAKPTAKPSKLAKSGKPAKVAVVAKPPAKPAVREAATAVPPKPAKPAKPAKASDHIPSLRMTADASKP